MLGFLNVKLIYPVILKYLGIKGVYVKDVKRLRMI